MADLKAMCEQMNLKNVTTYIQSGNVIFSVDKSNPADISKKIESAIHKKFGMSIPVITRTIDEIRNAIKRNPYLAAKDKDLGNVYLTYLEFAPGSNEIAAIRDYSAPPDDFLINGETVYIYCPGGYGNTKLNNNFFERKLKTRATTRNWKTSNELLNIATKIEELL